MSQKRPFLRRVEGESELASMLTVDPRDVLIIGSTAVGISLSPYKNLKLFDNDSYVDVAVLAHYHPVEKLPGWTVGARPAG